ncbi:MAG: hypothetical protein ABW217_13405 [Polyangiaceae bacterium]
MAKYAWLPSFALIIACSAQPSAPAEAPTAPPGEKQAPQHEYVFVEAK